MAWNWNVSRPQVSVGFGVELKRVQLQKRHLRLDIQPSDQRFVFRLPRKCLQGLRKPPQRCVCLGQTHLSAGITFAPASRYEARQDTVPSRKETWRIRTLTARRILRFGRCPTIEVLMWASVVVPDPKFVEIAWSGRLCRSAYRADALPKSR